MQISPNSDGSLLETKGMLNYCQPLNILLNYGYINHLFLKYLPIVTVLKQMFMCVMKLSCHVGFVMYVSCCRSEISNSFVKMAKSYIRCDVGQTMCTIKCNTGDINFIKVISDAEWQY